MLIKNIKCSFNAFTDSVLYYTVIYMNLAIFQ